jgi:hypothetical protein
MKRQLISLIIILPLLSLFSSLEIYAQPGTGKLPGDEAKPKPKPDIRGAKSTPKIDRVSLTTMAYAERYQKIYANYRRNDPASAEETVAKLEDLVKLAPDDDARSITFQFLGLIYLHGRNDAGKAEAAMERAIKANGSAIVEITFDNKWRQMTKLRSGDYGFEDTGRGWLKIGPGQITLIDQNSKTLASLTGQQIRELTKTLISAYALIKINADNTRKPYVFAAGAKRQAEADLVIKLIQKHVIGKATMVGRR